MAGPNHKTWKWSDTTKLMNYGIENFHQEIVGEDTITLGPITIKDGQVESVRASSDIESRELLMKEGDEFWMDILMPSTLSAPVAADEMVGTVVYYLNGEVLDLFPIYIEDDSRMIDYPWCLQQIFQKWLGKSILTVQ